VEALRKGEGYIQHVDISPSLPGSLVVGEPGSREAVGRGERLICPDERFLPPQGYGLRHHMRSNPAHEVQGAGPFLCHEYHADHRPLPPEGPARCP
jgi:hypothetical protein